MLNSDSIPPVAPQEGSGDHHADNEAAKEHGQHPENDLLATQANQVGKKGFVPFLPSIFSRALEGTLSWIFWLYGSDFQGAGHKGIGYLFNCLAVTCFLLLGADFLFSFWQNRNRVAWILAASCFVNVIVYSILYSEQNRPTATLPWQPPELDKREAFVTVQLGDYLFGLPIKIPGDFSNDLVSVPVHIPGIAHPIPLSVNLQNDRLYLNASIAFDTGSHTTITIHGITPVDRLYPKEWGAPKLPLKWDLNFSQNAIEVVDEKFLPVLQVVYLQPNEIRVNGYLAEAGDKYYWMLGETTNEIRDFPFYRKPRDLKPLFKYPSALHKGEYAN